MMQQLPLSDGAASFKHEQRFAHLRPNSAWYCARALLPPSAEQLAEGESLAACDIDFVEQVIGLNPQSRILEIGCAWGRHSLELAQRYYTQVVSIDVCSEWVAYAQARARSAGYHLNFLAMDYLD